MLSLIAEIKIAGAAFNQVGSVKITTSVDEYMDRATLVIPNAYRKNVKKGDEVSIRLGYDRYGLNQEFFGEVTEIAQQSPFEIRCADPFYNLSTTNLNKQYHGKSLDAILRDILRGTGVTLLVSALAKKTILKSFTTVNVGPKGPYGLTIRATIKKLANEHGFYAFFSERRLRFLHHSEAVLPWESYPLYEEGKNIIENNLLYGEPKAIKRVKVVSDAGVGSYVHAYYPFSAEKKPGVEKFYYVDGLSDGPACASRAKELYDQLTASGFYGELKTFGYPYVRAGQFCGIKMKSKSLPVIQSIRKTDVTFDRSGFRRVIIPLNTPQKVIDENQLTNKVVANNYLGSR